MLEEVEEEVYEPRDDLTWDYLRAQSGKVVRRRDVDDFDAGDWDDFLHFNDAQGTAKNEELVQRDESPPDIGYAVSAAGEPLTLASGAPDDENHIQWQGAFLEDKELTTTADSGRGYFYRMGVRHYSPAFGRFLQRDPVNNYRPPSPMNPLAHNPYQYGYNQATQYTDTSGYQCCGGGVGGSGEMTEFPPEQGQCECIIPWPENSGCIASTCYLCCVGATGITPDPCADATCLFLKTPDDWTTCECFTWCYNEAQGGENHPSSQGLGGISWAPGVIRGPLEPPSYGPDGSGGDIWGFIPWIPFGPPDHFPFIPIPWQLKNSSYGRRQFNILGFRTTPGIGFMGCTTLSIIPWWIFSPIVGVGLATLYDLGGTLFCTNFYDWINCDDEGYQCYKAACCKWLNCLKDNFKMYALFAIGSVAIAIIGGLTGGIGLIPFAIIGVAWGFTYQGINCGSTLISDIIGCDIFPTKLDQLKADYPECFP